MLLSYRLKETEKQSSAEIRERMATYGSDVLTIQECFQLLLGDDLGYRGEEISMTELDYLLAHGKLTKAKKVKLAALKTLTKHINRGFQDEVEFSSPSAVYNLLKEDLIYLKQEKFLVCCLDTKNRVIDVVDVFTGSLNKAIVHPREVFNAAIRRHAASIICVHNHPSGDTTPSRQDIALTERLVEAGDLMGIKVLDHVIIGSEGYTSLKEQGAM